MALGEIALAAGPARARKQTNSSAAAIDQALDGEDRIDFVECLKRLAI
nr:hypothetical protein [Mesorhizobium sp. WSM4875]WIE94659.1 hypothetical protein P9270_030580 [Mesorhizobium sp. WSM4875]